MKCVKHRRTGDIYRVSGNLAALLVATGAYTHTTKGAWKSQGRKYGVPSYYKPRLMGHE